MLTDEFIETVITPESKHKNEDMIAREFNGLESVASFKEGERETEFVEDQSE